MVMRLFGIVTMYCPNCDASVNTIPEKMPDGTNIYVCEKCGCEDTMPEW